MGHKRHFSVTPTATGSSWCSGHQVTPMGSPLPTLARRPVPSARHHFLHEPDFNCPSLCLTFSSSSRNSTANAVDSAFDFQTQVPHGPAAVRVLIYRLCDSRERVQLTGSKSTW